MEPLFNSYTFTETMHAELDAVGHLVLPGLLTTGARNRLTDSLSHIQSIRPITKGHEPGRFAAEFDAYLESLIGHPDLVALAHEVLGEDIRYDHCVALNRQGGNQGLGWHSHSYGETDPKLGFLRIFFYVNGFELGDGNLKAVPGSHTYRDATLRAADDKALEAGWMAGKTNPATGAPLVIEALSAPPGSVVLMWTHAAHAVNPRAESSDTRWCVVYAYRNPGEPSDARWISPAFEQKMMSIMPGLMPLY